MGTEKTIKTKNSHIWTRVEPLGIDVSFNNAFPVKWIGDKYFQKDIITEYFEGQIQEKCLLIKPSKIIMDKIPSQEYHSTLKRAGFIIPSEKYADRYTLVKPITAEIINETLGQARIMDMGILATNQQQGKRYIDALISGRLYIPEFSEQNRDCVKTLENLIGDIK